MTAREQVEAEAEDFASRHYEDLPHHKDAAKRGFLAGRTVSAEQLEAAVASMREQAPDSAPNWFDWVWHRFARAAFRAAGFLIEGDDDE